MRTIYKYPIYPGCQNIALPMGAGLLSVIEQAGQIILYCLVNPNEIRKETRKIYIMGTGWNFKYEDSDRFTFIGSVIVASYVWHVFELGVTENDNQSD